MSLVLTLMAGFSVGMALLLAAVFTGTRRSLPLVWQAQLGGYLMLAGLALTQLAHVRAFVEPGQLVADRIYVLVLAAQTLGFYWLFLGMLRPDGQWRGADWLVPVVVFPLMMWGPLPVAVPLVMLLGAAASAHLWVLVYRLRAVRRWFALELRVLALFGVLAVAVAIAAGLALAGQGWRGYILVYGSAITAGFMLVGWLLLSVPDLIPKTREAVATAYAQSTLGKVDRDATLLRLQQLFEQEQIHRSDTVTLASVAELLGLSGHQLSELVNSHFGVGFSRFVRQYRVATARQMLIDEPRASVLSIGMAAGFSSQSSFYLAFKELVGEVPGEYRQRRLLAANTSK